jgi:hypothetical protein
LIVLLGRALAGCRTGDDHRIGTHELTFADQVALMEEWILASPL